MDTNILAICGESDEVFDFEKIKSDPNFVFEADPNFNPITLFNESGSAVTVNSWIECANYVNGGWITSFTNLINYEKNLFYVLAITSIFLIASNIYKKRNKNFKNFKII